MAQAGYMSGAVGYTEVEEMARERRTEVTKMPSEVEGGGSNFKRSVKQMASHSFF